MKNKRNPMILFVLTAVMVMLMTVSVSAVSETGRDKDAKLMKGVYESTVYVTDHNANNIRAHILRINNGADVALKVTTANYYNGHKTKASRDEFAENWSAEKWGYTVLEDQIKAYESTSDKEGKVIAGINGDFYLKDGGYNGQTMGKLIMEGNVINPTTDEPFFAVLSDGSFELRDGTAPTEDVVEALAGRRWIVRNGAVLEAESRGGETLESIGLTANGDVVIVTTDGREPSTAGTSTYDLANIMKQQGCENAILLDGGGSGTFMTKRSGDKKPVMRNVANDGYPRPVSSGLLIVKKSVSSGNAVSSTAALSMKDGVAKLTKKSGTYYYKYNGKGVAGFRIINDEQYLFNKKGKGLTKTVTIGKTKYYYKKGKLTKCSDKKAGMIAIGFCGASADGENLVYAYHYGDNMLNIGLNPMKTVKNGKMADWTNVAYVPWMAEERRVKTVVIGSGVKNIGNYFLYISKSPFNDDVKKIKTALKSVTIPASVTKIGNYAFYNHDKLKNITIPKKVSSIGKQAFAYNEKTTYTFQRTTPPKFGKNAFKTSKKKAVWKVPSKSKWKKLVKKSASKKGGFKGSVKYVK